mmetsp:Transcript_74760/g.211500  ORF Transcript_74760/g.211500 Transcript_74760/m.211500 type:complete len:235 (+) Transcript_74760:279-983(+)
MVGVTLEELGVSASLLHHIGTIMLPGGSTRVVGSEGAMTGIMKGQLTAAICCCCASQGIAAATPPAGLCGSGAASENPMATEPTAVVTCSDGLLAILGLAGGAAAIEPARSSASAFTPTSTLCFDGVGGIGSLQPFCGGDSARAVMPASGMESTPVKDFFFGKVVSLLARRLLANASVMRNSVRPWANWHASDLRGHWCLSQSLHRLVFTRSGAMMRSSSPWAKLHSAPRKQPG